MQLIRITSVLLVGSSIVVSAMAQQKMSAAEQAAADAAIKSSSKGQQATAVAQSANDAAAAKAKLAAKSKTGLPLDPAMAAALLHAKQLQQQQQVVIKSSVQTTGGAIGSSGSQPWYIIQRPTTGTDATTTVPTEWYQVQLPSSTGTMAAEIKKKKLRTASMSLQAKEFQLSRAKRKAFALSMLDSGDQAKLLDVSHGGSMNGQLLTPREIRKLASSRHAQAMETQGKQVSWFDEYMLKKRLGLPTGSAQLNPSLLMTTMAQGGGMMNQDKLREIIRKYLSPGMSDLKSSSLESFLRSGMTGEIGKSMRVQSLSEYQFHSPYASSGFSSHQSAVMNKAKAILGKSAGKF